LNHSDFAERKSSNLLSRYDNRYVIHMQVADFQNLDSFSDDLNKQIRVAMERYIDTMHGTAATVAQSTEVARHAIQAINLDQDSRSSPTRASSIGADLPVSIWRSRINTAIGNSSIEPVPYHNFYVGVPIFDNRP